jgi:hypothetical protein
VTTLVLNAGPIPHSELARFDDADIETARSFPFAWRPTTTIDALKRGETLPPIVVVQTDRDRGYGLIDGLNRTYAHWLANRPTIRAYELIVG